MDEKENTVIDEEVSTEGWDEGDTPTYMGYITETIKHSVVLFDKKYEGLAEKELLAEVAKDWYLGNIPHTASMSSTTFE